MRAQERAACTSCHKEYPIGWIQDDGRCRMCTEKGLVSPERKQAQSIRAQSERSASRSSFPAALIAIGVGIVGAPLFGGPAEGIVGYFFSLVWIASAVLLALYLLFGERVAGSSRSDTVTTLQDKSRQRSY